MKITDLKLNEANPRRISNTKLNKLAKSIKEFPKMMELRPIIYDKNKIIIGGNMRYLALQRLNYKDIPDGWAVCADDLSEEDKKRFIIEDNVSFGDWDWDVLVDWKKEDLIEWGLDVGDDYDKAGRMRDIPDVGEMEFSEELLLEHNYVVLYFDNPLDWEVAKEKLGLKNVKSNVPKKSQKVGIGRVLKGKDIINRLN